MTMTREQFMELMNLREDDDAMEYADEAAEEGKTYFEIAQEMGAALNYLAQK